MKHLLKSALMALAVFGFVSVTSASDAELDGHKVVSTSFFGSYFTRITGQFRFTFMEMNVFPNGVVKGGFGFSDDDAGEGSYPEYQGSVDKNGIFHAEFQDYRRNKSYKMIGVIAKNTRKVSLVITQQGRMVGRVDGGPEWRTDFAPSRASLVDTYFHIDTNNGSPVNIYFVLHPNGTFDATDVSYPCGSCCCPTTTPFSGTYSSTKTGKNISQITLNGDGCSGFASRTETVFWMESDAGVVFDRKDSRWLSWDTNSWSP